LTISTMMPNLHPMLRQARIQNRLRLVVRLLLGTLAYTFLAVEPVVKAGVLFSNLFSFNNLQSGSDPRPRLVLYPNDFFYGTTSGGGTYAQGTVLRATPGGLVTNLVIFNGTNGSGPIGGLTLADNGYFYGTTMDGGISNAGTVFRVSAQGSFSSLASFTNGEAPSAGLIQAKDGYLYGTTQFGGTYALGTIFRMSLDGLLTTVFSFPNTNGYAPAAELTQAADGSLYGTTAYGGLYGAGAAFRMTLDGSVTFLAQFNYTNGYRPSAAMIQASDGNFYGTTIGALSGNYGNVFRLTTNGSLTSLVSFDGTNGANSLAALVQASDGILYGTTIWGGPTGRYGPGTVFRITLDGCFSTVYAFTGTIDGIHPRAALLQAADGNLYGLTSEGGSYSSGNIFKVSVPMPPILNPPQIAAGRTIVSWSAIAGQIYQLEYQSGLRESGWTPSTGPLLAGGGWMSYSNLTAGTQGFYRVSLLP
jgi:uncharacterized repeat protein (TIGR03803 family)